MNEISVKFEVNGKEHSVQAPPMARLLDVLREDLGFFGTKEGCGEGECGACSVMVNGRLVNSCLMPVIQAEGAKVTTVEGLAKNGELHPVQKAFFGMRWRAVRDLYSWNGACRSGSAQALSQARSPH